MIYKTNVNSSLNVLNDVLTENLAKLWDLFQNEVKNTMFFTVIKVKIVYNTAHNLIKFKIDSEIYLWFNKEYHLSNHFTSKISNQCCESFKILQKVRSLVYWLKLSEEWRIHFIVLIAQLKSMLKKNSYEWSKLEKSFKINVNSVEQYVIEKIVIKCVKLLKNQCWNQYLI